MLSTLLTIISNGLFNNKINWGVESLCTLGFCKAWGSDPTGLGSSCGCFGSYSEVWTKDPFHYLTISVYGNLNPDLSEIANACLPEA